LAPSDKNFDALGLMLFNSNSDSVSECSSVLNRRLDYSWAADFFLCLDFRFLRMRRSSMKLSAVIVQSTDPDIMVTIVSIAPGPSLARTRFYAGGSLLLEGAP